MPQQRFGPMRFIAVVFLFAVLAAELSLSIRRESQTFDEGTHIYAGYGYWKVHDFGLNPEHPPLAKLIATVPLLPLHVELNPAPNIYFRGASAMAGRQLLYTHDAEMLLFRTRMMISIFTFVLALLVFVATREMFGWEAALIALVLLVFEPNVLAHGALVTTDMGVTAMMFGAVYTFYRYLKHRTFPRLLVCSLFAGLTLSVKHSGILVLSVLAVLAIVDLFVGRDGWDTWRTRSHRALASLGSLVFISAVSVAMLWSCYGFRYAARPQNRAMVPPTAAFLETLHRPAQSRAIAFAETHHLLPEAYLYGLTDIAVLTSEGRSTYLFGKGYAEGQWFYFPSTFLIKSTLGFLLLLVIAVCAPRLRSREWRAASLTMLIPAAMYMAFAMHSKLDIGHRHILPIYPFLIVLIAAGAWALMRRSRMLGVAVMVLLLMHAASSLRAYPAYLAYSNEVWGGPSNTYKVLSDSSIGWASGITDLQQYIADHRITQCWYAHYGLADLSYFRLPCKRMPTFFSILSGDEQSPVPQIVQGPVFVASEDIAGTYFGPQQTSPYWQFKDRKPDAVLRGEILVYNGTYDVRGVSALSHFAIASRAMRFGHPETALRELQQAESIAPEMLMPHQMLASLYAGAHRKADAEREYMQAMNIYNTTYGDFTKHIDPPQDPFPSEHTLASAKQPGN